jgi:hypothetical protein
MPRSDSPTEPQVSGSDPCSDAVQHIERHTECDDTVGVASTSGDLAGAVAVRHDDLVAEVAGGRSDGTTLVFTWVDQ